LTPQQGTSSKYTKRKEHATYLTFSWPKNPKEDSLKFCFALLCFALLCIVWSALALGQLLHILYITWLSCLPYKSVRKLEKKPHDQVTCCLSTWVKYTKRRLKSIVSMTTDIQMVSPKGLFAWKSQ
jgi:hypothetical protein